MRRVNLLLRRRQEPGAVAGGQTAHLCSDPLARCGSLSVDWSVHTGTDSAGDFTFGAMKVPNEELSPSELPIDSRCHMFSKKLLTVLHSIPASKFRSSLHFLVELPNFSWHRADRRIIRRVAFHRLFCDFVFLYFYHFVFLCFLLLSSFSFA
jgi:hypothetical protein